MIAQYEIVPLRVKAECGLTGRHTIRYDEAMQTQQNRIRELRGKKGWSMAALAKHVGTTAATIDRLEKSKIKLTVEWMTRLAGPLAVRPGDLVPWDKDQFLEPPPGEYRWGEAVDARRVAVRAAFGVLAATIPRVPEAFWEAPWMPELFSILQEHYLDGFPLSESGTEACLWGFCGQPEKAAALLRRQEEELEEQHNRLKQETTEADQKAKGLQKLRARIGAVAHTIDVTSRTDADAA